MPTEQAGIPQHSAVAQQAHQAAQTDDRKPQPEPAPIAAAAAARPGSDLSTPRAIGRAIGCLLRPYPIDDTDPRGSKRRVAVICAGAVGVVALLVRLRRSR